MNNRQKNQTIENYLENLEESCLKKNIEALAVPWNKFYYVGRFSEIYYDTTALTRLLVNLLHTVKLEKIEIQCGIGMRCILDGYAKYDFIRKNIEIGDCVVKVKQNLNIGKFDLVYNDILLIGESIEEPDKENVKESLKTEDEYFWKRFKNWLGIN